MVVSPWQSPTYFMTTKPTSQRAYDIDSFLVRASDLDWLKGDRLKDLQAQARAGHKWIPAQQLPYNETILYAYAADRTNRPTSCVYHQDCTMHAPGVSWHKLALNKKSHRYRIQHRPSPPTYQAPKKHQYVMPPHTACKHRISGRRRKRCVTSSLPLLRTKPKTAPALVGQPSVLISI